MSPDCVLFSHFTLSWEPRCISVILKEERGVIVNICRETGYLMPDFPETFRFLRLVFHFCHSETDADSVGPSSEISRALCGFRPTAAYLRPFSLSLPLLHLWLFDSCSLMDYGKPDSSGTDDDIPVQNINRFGRGLVRMMETMRVPTATMPQGGASSDMEEKIHNLEMEAYDAVLKAFIAQSDDLSWGKEKLISQLRHELRISEIEHIESLATVDSDDLVQHIREWRKGARGSQELLSNTTYASGVVPGSTLVNAHKKLKTAHLAVSPSPNYLPLVQSSSPNYAPRVQSSAGIQSAHLRDNQWSESALVNEGNVGQSMKSMGHSRQLSATGKGRGSLKVHLGKSYASLPSDGSVRVADKIEIRETHVIIHEVERLCGLENPNPALLEKAKLILKEQEQSLLEAIAKLESMADLGA